MPNRLMKAALSEALANLDNAPTNELIRVHQSWSTGGYGLIVTGNVMIDRRHVGEPGNVVIEDDRHIGQLRRWASTMKAGGSEAWMQLNHPGRQSAPSLTGHQPVAPSAVVSTFFGATPPVKLEANEIEQVIQRFVTAARHAQEAGFDGVQVHAAHGYLISQFLSPLSNLRQDEWGTDELGRMRLLTEVVRRIRQAVGPSFGLGVKLNSADFQHGGFSPDASKAVISALSALAVDLIEVSGGNYESFAMLGAGMSQSTLDREAYFLSYAKEVRKAAGAVPLAVTGGFRSASVMRSAISNGDCDVIGLGRPTCVSPAAGSKVLAGECKLAVNFPPAEHEVMGIDWYTSQLHRVGAS